MFRGNWCFKVQNKIVNAKESQDSWRKRRAGACPGEFLSRRNIRFHYACLLEGLRRRRFLACTSGSTGIKMSIVDIVSARRHRAGLSRGRNLTNETKPRVLAGKRRRGWKKKKKRTSKAPFLMYLPKESSARYRNVREAKSWFIRSNIYVTLFYWEVRKTSKSFHYLSRLVIWEERKKADDWWIRIDIHS